MEEDAPDSPRSVIQPPPADISEARVYRTWDSGWRQASFGFQAVRYFAHDLFMEIELQFAMLRIGGVSGNLVAFGKTLIVLGVLKERDGFIVGYGWFVEALRRLFSRR